MPVKIWEVNESGFHSRVVTGWDTLVTAEESREDAEELDRRLDDVLDSAMKRVSTNKITGASSAFLRAWAVGRALEESGVYHSAALENEHRQLLWRALARKCRFGVRSTRKQDMGWRGLRPLTAGQPRREWGELDHFEMCRWLAEQDLEDAITTFGGSIRNVWHMLERPTLRPIGLRRIIREWFASFPDDIRQRLFQQSVFTEIMKTLQRRGSAKKPIHCAEDKLKAKVYELLAPFSE